MIKTSMLIKIKQYLHCETFGIAYLSFISDILLFYIYWSLNMTSMTIVKIFNYGKKNTKQKIKVSKHERKKYFWKIIKYLEVNITWYRKQRYKLIGWCL